MLFQFLLARSRDWRRAIYIQSRLFHRPTCSVVGTRSQSLFWMSGLWNEKVLLGKGSSSGSGLAKLWASERLKHCTEQTNSKQFWLQRRILRILQCAEYFDLKQRALLSLNSYPICYSPKTGMILLERSCPSGIQWETCVSNSVSSIVLKSLMVLWSNCYHSRNSCGRLRKMVLCWR